MEIVRYRRGKLLLAALLMALSAALFLILFLYPESAARLRGARLFATSIGHNLIAPGLIAASAYVAVRSATLAFGSAAAIEARGDALYVTTMTGRHRIAWVDLAAVGLQPAYGHDHLVFHSRTPGPFGASARRVPLAQVDLHPDMVEGLFDRIERVRAGIPASGPAAPARRPEPGASARPTFGRKAI